MKKSRKYGLIAGGVTALVVTLALVYSGYNTGRMPTLPTPPGVIVPTGMRYVGGDEFDATTPSIDMTKYAIRGNMAAPDPVAKIDKGVLILSPHGKAPKTRLVCFDQRQGPAGTIPGRIEFRARMNIEAIQRRLTLGKSDGFITNIGFDLIGSGIRAVQIPMLHIEYHRSPPQILEYTQIGAAPLVYDGDFHVYSIEWNGRMIHCHRDGLENGSTASLRENLNRPIIPFRWHSNLDFIPSAITKPLFELKHWDFDHPHRLSIDIKDPVPDPADPLSLEIDYIRIFQE